MKLYGKLGILPAVGLFGWFILTTSLDHAQNKRLDALEKRTRDNYGIVIGGTEYSVFKLHDAPTNGIESNEPIR